MTAYKTPGVYVEEIATLPASVARVATAIPAFIGYTERAAHGGRSLENTAYRVESRVDFEAAFGGPSTLGKAIVTLSSPNGTPHVKLPQRYYLYDAIRLFYDNGGGACYVVSVGTYGKGGGGDESEPECNALRAGLDEVARHDEPTLLVVPDAMRLGPEGAGAVYKHALAQCRDLQDRFTICDVYEAESSGTDSARVRDDVDSFRDQIGINDLKYGAAYSPWLQMGRGSTVRLDDIVFTPVPPNDREKSDEAEGADQRSQVAELRRLLSDRERDSAGEFLSHLEEAQEGRDRVRKGSGVRVNESARAKLDTLVENAIHGVDQVTRNTLNKDDFDRFRELMTFAARHARTLETECVEGTLPKALQRAALDLRDAKVTDAYGAVARILESARQSFSKRQYLDAASLFGEGSWPDAKPDLIEGDDKPSNSGPDEASDDGTGEDPSGGDEPPVEKPEPEIQELPGATEPARLREAVQKLKGPIAIIVDTVDRLAATAQELTLHHEGALYQNWPLYARIVDRIREQRALVPPSGAVVGAIATVDRTRGVWKAPANISLNGVYGVTRIIDDRCQADLNVDPSSGKSINAIRAFAGKGILIWGARTLAGNDNEWCFVSVRRFFNMVEESVRKALGPIVFEPNDATTWLRVRSMLENFLNSLWRAGALAGAKPEAAYFVNVGLGRTMTADDVLAGRLIVEIGLATVRPAEFIVVKFSHKMQTA